MPSCSMFRRKQPPTYGYTWLIEWTTTSFYLKNLYMPLQSAKISIHGPDSNHVGKQHFRFDLTKPEEPEGCGEGRSGLGVRR